MDFSCHSKAWLCGAAFLFRRGRGAESNSNVSGKWLPCLFSGVAVLMGPSFGDHMLSPSKMLSTPKELYIYIILSESGLTESLDMAINHQGACRMLGFWGSIFAKSRTSDHIFREFFEIHYISTNVYNLALSTSSLPLKVALQSRTSQLPH